jgi:hypothetical protein
MTRREGGLEERRELNRTNSYVTRDKACRKPRSGD